LTVLWVVKITVIMILIGKVDTKRTLFIFNKFPIPNRQMTELLTDI
jgi:hypothetical protein